MNAVKHVTLVPRPERVRAKMDGVVQETQQKELNVPPYSAVRIIK